MLYMQQEFDFNGYKINTSCRVLNDQLFKELKLLGFGFNMNIIPLTLSLTCNPIPACGESNKPNKVFLGHSNQQMGNKLQRDGSDLGPSVNQQMGNKLQRGGLNLRPPAKPDSNTMLNDQLS